jgi:hypothetical protein
MHNKAPLVDSTDRTTIPFTATDLLQPQTPHQHPALLSFARMMVTKLQPFDSA